jgi:hypothetical protein
VRLAEQGVDYLESPIAASSEQTRRGEAMAIVAGPEPAFAACRDVFDALAAKSFHVGPWGSAAKVKLVNNLILGLERVALAEGLVFAEAIGLDRGKTLDVLKQGNAYSVVMDTKGRKMVEGDFSLQAKLSQHAKDVRIILAAAARHGLSLPLSALHLQLLEEAEAAGLGELDNSAIIRVIQQRAESPLYQPGAASARQVCMAGDSAWRPTLTACRHVTTVLVVLALLSMDTGGIPAPCSPPRAPRSCQFTLAERFSNRPLPVRPRSAWPARSGPAAPPTRCGTA